MSVRKNRSQGSEPATQKAPVKPKILPNEGTPRVEVCEKGKVGCNRIPSGVSILHMALSSLARSCSHSLHSALCHCVRDEHEGAKNCYCNAKRHG